jgi:hypothetical protein
VGFPGLEKIKFLAVVKANAGSASRARKCWYVSQRTCFPSFRFNISGFSQAIWRPRLPRQVCSPATSARSLKLGAVMSWSCRLRWALGSSERRAITPSDEPFDGGGASPGSACCSMVCRPARCFGASAGKLACPSSGRPLPPFEMAN